MWFSVLLTPWWLNKELLKSFKLHLMWGLPASHINLRDENVWDETIEFATKITKKTCASVYESSKYAVSASMGLISSAT